MILTLEPIPQNADKNSAIFASEDCQNLLKMWEDYYPQIGFHLPWVGYFVIRDNEIVGSCALMYFPLHGKVEISYWTFAAYEGQGIATSACQQLIQIAKETDNTLTITAKTAPSYTASTSILKKCGFQFSEVVQDHEIGDAWEWIFHPAS